MKCFSGCELKPAWTSGLRQTFQSSLGNWCCFPGELSRELAAFAVLFVSSPMRPKYLLLMSVTRWTAGQCAGSQHRCLLTELCNWPVVILGKLDCGFLPRFSHHPFFPLPFLFFLFRQWAVWEKEMPLIMYIQHLSQWESYHKTRNQSEKSVNRTLFFSS